MTFDDLIKEISQMNPYLVFDQLRAFGEIGIMNAVELTKQTKKEQLDSMVATQCSDGNWNFNPYMHGMAVGLLLAQAVINDVPFEGLEAPDKWISDDAPISDGYHTFDELYEHRHALFLVVCRSCGGWKSHLHSDGTSMAGWFIAGVSTPKGMATYHVPDSWWDRYDIEELPAAPEWDGHTSQDVIERLQSIC